MIYHDMIWYYLVWFGCDMIVFDMIFSALDMLNNKLTFSSYDVIWFDMICTWWQIFLMFESLRWKGLLPFLALHSFSSPAVGLKPQSFTLSLRKKSRCRFRDSLSRIPCWVRERQSGDGSRPGRWWRGMRPGWWWPEQRDFASQHLNRDDFSVSEFCTSLEIVERQLESSLHGYNQCLHHSSELIKSSLEMCPCVRLRWSSLMRWRCRKVPHLWRSCCPAWHCSPPGPVALLTSQKYWHGRFMRSHWSLFCRFCFGVLMATFSTNSL